MCSVVCETEALKYEYSEWHNHIINSEIKAAFIQDLTFLVKALKAQNKDQIFGCVYVCELFVLGIVYVYTSSSELPHK